MAAARRANPGHHCAGVKASAARLRQAVLDSYGNRCACCGETEPAFLQLDHIDGGGREHRRQVGNDLGIYRAVRDEGFPTDKYRLLCANCNFVTRFGRVCPHLIAKTVEALLGAA